MYLLMWVQVQFLEPASEDSQWLETPDPGAPRSLASSNSYILIAYIHMNTHIYVYTEIIK